MGAKGIIEQTETLSGSLSGAKTMSGTLSMDSSMVGTLSGEVGLNAQLTSSIENRYEGAYVFTPSKDDQVIDTDYRLLTKDLTIKGIPYYEVSNENGITIIIGDY
jgi:hypothetical protein